MINVCQKLLYNSPRTVSEEALTLPVASESTLRAIVYVQFTRGGGRGYLGKFLLGMCRWPLRAPYPIIVYSSVANYRPHLSHFWVNM